MKNYKSGKIETQSLFESDIETQSQPQFRKSPQIHSLIEQMSKILGKFLIEDNTKRSGVWGVRAIELQAHINKLNEQRSN